MNASDQPDERFAIPFVKQRLTFPATQSIVHRVHSSIEAHHIALWRQRCTICRDADLPVKTLIPFIPAPVSLRIGPLMIQFP